MTLVSAKGAVKFGRDANICSHVSLDLFSASECKAIIDLGALYDLERGEPAKVEINDRWRVIWAYRRGKLVWLPKAEETWWIYERIVKAARDLNDEFWGFELSFVQELQLTRYPWLGHYFWHTDVGHGKNRFRKLSFSVQLSSARRYIGGNLLIREGMSTPVATRHQGSATFFPSFLVHRVTPVLGGTRYALVGWFHGEQSFR